MARPTRWAPSRAPSLSSARVVSGRESRASAECWEDFLFEVIGPRVEGRPTAPVLSPHDLGDLFVPFSMEQVYLGDATRNGRAHLVVQRDPHGRALRVQPGRGGAPWRDLLAWVYRGERPAGDVVDDPPCRTGSPHRGAGTTCLR
ncbi:hypothetical protein JOF41_004328 [Saccharothrix coeruleofusca]|uniref:hypothetical protein n=1 Tax=Saccharothrix coeruleofusca TaxID=33919 RepID=UPI001AE1C7B8|nr:hypothetical protein [Saccharothrix coeruleofusca]MBP2338150.1 hypothetical protein [Saccharothrix coeruleofusca]